HLALVKGFRADAVLGGLEDPVAAVLAAAHDEVGHHRLGPGAVVGHPQQDAPAGVGPLGQIVRQIYSSHKIPPYRYEKGRTAPGGGGAPRRSADSEAMLPVVCSTSVSYTACWIVKSFKFRFVS